ncbi:MFS transporter [Parahaliea mediterranea]|uniref:MFS transporter n=1 Tax=Parahaliea mediterranea TaxID=651086 RepID=UPI0013008C1C|nr:MFS transporter [Parahaliea mediterranea]
MPNRWVILAIATVMQNLAIGLTFGSYGLLIGEISEAFGSSRSQVSLGIACITLVMGVFSPLLGYLLDRYSIRNLMVFGSLTTALGFYLASTTTTLAGFLLCIGLVVGMGITAMGVLPASKLAANWFPESTGKALGFVSLPILIAIGPPLFSAVIAATGWRQLFVYFSLIYLAVLPLLLLVRNQPNAATRQPTAADAGARPAASTVRWSESLRDGRLWFIVLIAGVMFSGGIMLVTHIVQHAMDLGVAPTRAAILLSVNGTAALVGAMAFGWLCDRLSPAMAVCINLGLQALLWPVLLYQHQLTGLVPAIAVLGLCGGGAHPALSALVGQVFGAERFGTLMGQIALLVIPFNFGAAPLAGLLYDNTGSYTAAFWAYGGMCLAAALFMLLASRRVTGGASAAA